MAGGGKFEQFAFGFGQVAVGGEFAGFFQHKARVFRVVVGKMAVVAVDFFECFLDESLDEGGARGHGFIFNMFCAKI